MVKRIFEFTILHEGWEMDNDGWVTEDEKGVHELHTTNHGMATTMTKGELIGAIKETRDCLEGLLKAAELMGYME